MIRILKKNQELKVSDYESLFNLFIDIVQPTIKAKQIVNSKKTALEFPEIPSKGNPHSYSFHSFIFNIYENGDLVEKKSKKLSSYSKEEKKKGTKVKL